MHLSIVSLGFGIGLDVSCQSVDHLVWPSNRSTFVFAITTLVQLHELGDVELGLLHNLTLPDQHVLEWVDALGLLLDLLANGLRDQLLNKFTKLALARLGLADVNHLHANLADLR